MGERMILAAFGRALLAALLVALTASCAALAPAPDPRAARRSDDLPPVDTVPAAAGVTAPARPPAAAGGVLHGLVAGVAVAQEVDEPPQTEEADVGTAASDSLTPISVTPPAAPAVVPTQAPRRAYRLPMQTAAVAPEPAAGQPDLVVSPALATLVEHHLGGLRGDFGVAVKALDSGEGALLNADREFPAASLFKLPVMYEVFRQRDAGRLDLSERLVLTVHYAELDLGTLDLPVGASVSIADALERMIAVSDNATANLLADRVGWPSLNATARDLGLRETHLGGERLSTSPRDMLRLLELIARGDEPSAASTAAMRDLLLEQRVNDRLPAHLPPGTRVAHKTGNLGGIVHDVGIVYAPGAPFVIGLMAEDAWDQGAVVEAQASLTRAVYDYLLAAAAAPTATPTPSATPTMTPVPPRPTARRWQPPTTTPIVLPTARLWRSPTPTATLPPRGN